MATNWIFTSNTFEVQTRDNFKKMLSLSLDHYGKLVAAANTEAAIIPLRDDYAPLNLAFQNIYAAWKGAEGTHKGSTLSIEGMLEQLNTEIRTWEGTVRYIFPEDSPNERSIFPNKRAPFQTGTYEQRISAVQTLAEKLATFTTQPLLVTLSATVLSFYNTIEAVRLAQTGDEISITMQAMLLEEQRKACAVGMYGNLGRLMYIARNTPTDIEQFWDLSLLRNQTGELYKEDMTINPEMVKTVDLSQAQLNEIGANTGIKLENTSTASVTLKAGFSDEAGTAPAFSIAITPTSQRQLTASELGWSSDKKYLVIQNESSETGTMKVEVEV